MAKQAEQRGVVDYQQKEILESKTPIKKEVAAATGSDSSSTPAKPQRVSSYHPVMICSLFRQQNNLFSSKQYFFYDQVFVQKIWEKQIKFFSDLQLDVDPFKTFALQNILLTFWLDLVANETVSIVQAKSPNPFLPFMLIIDKQLYRQVSPILYFSLCVLLKFSASDTMGARLREPVDSETPFELLPIMSGAALDYLVTLMLALSEVFISIRDTRSVETAVMSILNNWFDN